MILTAAIRVEVMDKEWPLWFVLLSLVGLGLVGMFVCRKWPATIVLVLALASLVGSRQLMELGDPYIGPAIRHEAGLLYVTLSYASVAASRFLPALGAWQGYIRGKRHASSAPS